MGPNAKQQGDTAAACFNIWRATPVASCTEAMACFAVQAAAASRVQGFAIVQQASHVLDLHDLLRQRVGQHDKAVPRGLHAVRPLDLRVAQ